VGDHHYEHCGGDGKAGFSARPYREAGFGEVGEDAREE
jgi:hypothetical protein